MLNLTPQERRVILFLIIVVLAGIGINFLAKNYSQIRIIAQLNQDIGRVELNKADKDILIGVTGIGEKLARRIIEYRQKQGGFDAAEELKNIKGINKSKYELIKDYFIIE